MDQSLFVKISGTLIVQGYEPDGDSVRFIPSSAATLMQLKNHERAVVSSNGSVQLRLEAIDAPETHFEGRAQPLGVSSRSTFLRSCGFSQVDFATSGKVVSATPQSVPATILSKMFEVNGRPVAYLFVGEARNFLTSHPRLVPGAALLERSLNAQMLKNGAAYPTLYASTPSMHRELFISIAKPAKAARRGVWQHDKSAAFTLENQASLGPRGQQLILPKLFRRCIDFLKARDKGFDGDFVVWLKTAMSRGLSEDDAVLVGPTKTKLSQLVRVQQQTVHFTGDLLDLVFIEK